MTVDVTSVASGRLERNPMRQVQKVMVVSHDLRQQDRKATMPLMTQCQMASCPFREGKKRERFVTILFL